MKLRQEDNLVLSNGTGEKKFTIAATAKAFQILSSALYSRKVEAIVRELSCNAYDSHVQAGCADRPFAIYLPNEWESEFAVEDFGIGLDDDAVMNIYTSYFTSTKTDSNEVIGGLGLGSKTPFAYTDSFNIRARKDGVERTYNAYISSSGEPSVSLLTEHATTEPNGVKVTVPVRAGDRQQFIDDCVKVHRWFSVKPEYHGYSGVLNVDNAVLADIEEHGHVIINARNCVHYTGAYSYSDFVRVLMGNVSYFVPNVRAQFGDHLGDGVQPRGQRHRARTAVGQRRIDDGKARQHPGVAQADLAARLGHADHGVAGHTAQLLGDLAGRLTLQPQLLQRAYAIVGPACGHATLRRNGFNM